MYPILLATPGMHAFADAVDTERQAQLTKWGDQHHPDGTGQYPEQIHADVARMVCQQAAEGGYLDWLHILREEVAEAFSETDPTRLRAELIQVAAVCAAWIHDLDSRAPQTADAPPTPASAPDIEADNEQLRQRLDRIIEHRNQVEAERDGAYRERAQLVAHLAALHPSHIGHTDPNAPDWAVVIIETPAGQMSWHVSPRDMDLFEHVEQTRSICRAWDGHTTEEKYARLRQLITRILRPTRA